MILSGGCDFFLNDRQIDHDAISIKQQLRNSNYSNRDTMSI